jgi:putative oxidoreductase
MSGEVKNGLDRASAKDAGAERGRSLGWLTKLERFGVLYARIALGVGFLSAVADRFGLWGKYAGWGNFTTFTEYTAQVTHYLPGLFAPLLAWAATVVEIGLGVLLILGLWPRWVSLASAFLLAMFGISMAISFSVKSPLDYSVFAASSAAMLLAIWQNREEGLRR